MSFADQIDARNSAAADARWGELVEIRPQKPGGQTVASSIDPDRPVRQVRVTVSIAPTTTRMDGMARGDARGLSRLKVAKSQMWLSAATVAALGFTVAKDDHVAFVSRPGVPVFMISDPGTPTDRGDVVMELVKT